MPDEERNGQPKDDFFPLDEPFIALLNEVREQAKTLNLHIQGALLLYLRQHNLAGRWEIAENGRELRRRDDPVAVMTQES
jgi:hypothetical protein